MKEFTKKQAGAIAQALRTLDLRLRADLRAALLQSGDPRDTDLAGMVHDRGEESIADMLTDLNNALTGRHLRELREIEAAQQRLAEGVINRCAECSNAIGHARLLVYPLAVRCIVCQEQFEKTRRHESTPRM